MDNPTSPKGLLLETIALIDSGKLAGFTEAVVILHKEDGGSTSRVLGSTVMSSENLIGILETAKMDVYFEDEEPPEEDLGEEPWRRSLRLK